MFGFLFLDLDLAEFVEQVVLPFGFPLTIPTVDGQIPAS